MPLVRISLLEGQPAEYSQAIADEVHAALVEVAKVPLLDRFQILTTHASRELIYDQSYLGINRTDSIVVIQITLNQRPLAVKQAIYKAIADKLSRRPGLRREDVLISLVCVAPEDWSFGNGIAQYAQPNTLS